MHLLCRWRFLSLEYFLVLPLLWSSLFSVFLRHHSDIFGLKSQNFNKKLPNFLKILWVLESMAAANALSNPMNMSNSTESLLSDRSTNEHPMTTRRRNMFEITERIELGKMANMFFSRTGVFLFYLCIIIYLFGDLAIYAAAVPKNVRDLVCNFHNKSNIDQCWSNKYSIVAGSSYNSREKIYKISLVLFMISVGPFTFCNLQKTKFLQIFTSCFRWLAFTEGE